MLVPSWHSPSVYSEEGLCCLSPDKPHEIVHDGLEFTLWPKLQKLVLLHRACVCVLTCLRESMLKRFCACLHACVCVSACMHVHFSSIYLVGSRDQSQVASKHLYLLNHLARPWL